MAVSKRNTAAAKAKATKAANERARIAVDPRLPARIGRGQRCPPLTNDDDMQQGVADAVAERLAQAQEEERVLLDEMERKDAQVTEEDIELTDIFARVELLKARKAERETGRLLPTSATLALRGAPPLINQGSLGSISWQGNIPERTTLTRDPLQ